MAQVFVSPGVYTQEIDDTFRPAGSGAIGAALIGFTQKGEAFRPINVNNFSEFQDKFGELSRERYMPYAAQNYLRNGSNLKVVKVLGRSTNSVGETIVVAFPTDVAETSTFPWEDDTLPSYGPGDAFRIGAILRIRGAAGADQNWQLSGVATNFSLVKVNGDTNLAADSGGHEVYSGDTGTTFLTKDYSVTGLSLDKDSDSYIGKVLGTDPKKSNPGELLPDLYVDAIFDYDIANLEGTINSGADLYASATANDSGSQGISDTVVGGFSTATSPFIVSQNYGGTVFNLFKFETVGHGSYENSNLKVSITNVDVNDDEYPSFSVVVRRYGDSDAAPVVLATYEGVNLDPSSKNYIAKVIGTSRPTYDFGTNPPTIVLDGDFPTPSNAMIRVQMGDPAPADARPQGFRGITSLAASGVDVATKLTGPGNVPYKTNHLINGQPDSRAFMGVDFSQLGVTDALKRTITSPNGYSIEQKGLLIIYTAGEGTSANDLADRFEFVNFNQPAVQADTQTTNPIRFTAPMFGGWDGFDPRVDLRLAANESGTNSVSAEFIDAVNILSNPDEVDFNLLAIPDVHSSGEGNIPQKAISMVESRGDAFVLVDLANGNSTTADGINMTHTQAITEGNGYDSSYAATYYPWLSISDQTSLGGQLYVPPSVAMMGVYAFSDKVGDPWFAPAGFNRGSAFPSSTRVRRTLTQAQRDELYQAGVNPIASFANQGVVAFGQKTLQAQPSVLDRVNVRRMLIEVRKTISGLSRLFLFEPNTVSVRRRLLDQVNAYLSLVQNRQGLTEFRAVLDETTTTPDLIDRNTMKGKIFLKPTTAAEVILFDFTVTPQGATFDE